MGARVSVLPDLGFWQGRRVLVTGHTGFKGSWLTFWLHRMGARVFGVALPEPPSEPSLWEQIDLGVEEVRTDIRSDAWHGAAASFQPEVVLHLAAQPLVSVGYAQPRTTFDTNVAGTQAVLDQARRWQDLLACVVVTTDKVYDPRQQGPHRESDFLGGHDPYSASKAAAELAVASWPVPIAGLATARAGNVIGGGDWARDRLLPDLVRAWSQHTPVALRNTSAVRPWQHVVEPLAGYLAYAQHLASGFPVPTALNFGPHAAEMVSVGELVAEAARIWGPEQAAWTDGDGGGFHENPHLTLDSTLAAQSLGWSGVMDWRQSLTLTLTWYRGWLAGTPAGELMAADLDRFSELAGEAG